MNLSPLLIVPVILKVSHYHVATESVGNTFEIFLDINLSKTRDVAVQTECCHFHLKTVQWQAVIHRQLFTVGIHIVGTASGLRSSFFLMPTD